MGLIDRALGGAGIEGLVEGAEGLSEVFVPNATRAMELASEFVRRHWRLRHPSFNTQATVGSTS